MALLLVKVCVDDNTNNLLQNTINVYKKHSGTALGGGEMPKQIFLKKTQHTVLNPKTHSENRLLNIRPHRLSSLGCFSCTAFWVFSMVGAHIWMSLVTGATGRFRECLGHRRHTNTPTCTNKTVCDWQRTCVAVNTN